MPFSQYRSSWETTDVDRRSAGRLTFLRESGIGRTRTKPRTEAISPTHISKRTSQDTFIDVPPLMQSDGESQTFHLPKRFYHSHITTKFSLCQFVSWTDRNRGFIRMVLSLGYGNDSFIFGPFAP